MITLLDIVSAREYLNTLCPFDVVPCLEPVDVELILSNARIASIWEAETDYAIGDKVIPTEDNRNGHLYQVVAFDGDGTTSDDTEPEWSTLRDSEISDGNIIWREAGYAPSSLWDMTQAACDAWQAKAAKTANRYDFQSLDQRFSASQLYDHCVRQADRYRPTRIL